MVNILVKDSKGAVVENASLPEEVFNITTNVPLIHQVIVAELAASRQGTHKAKNRSEVSGGGKKPYRQKGTGNARQGSTRSPQYAGGGVVHGPQPRDYSQKTPKKMVRSAICGAISNRVRTENLHIVTGFENGKEISTKKALSTLVALNATKRVLVVSNSYEDFVSLRNIAGVEIVQPKHVNAYNVIVSDSLVWTKDAIVEFSGENGVVEFSKATKTANPKTSATKVSATKAKTATKEKSISTKAEKIKEGK